MIKTTLTFNEEMVTIVLTPENGQEKMLLSAAVADKRPFLFNIRPEGELVIMMVRPEPGPQAQ